MKPEILVGGFADLGLFNGHENQCTRHGNTCQRVVLYIILFQVHNFSSFYVQEVSLFWVCLILCAIEFFEGSIECLYSFFLEF
jgi:hypothetical protein